MYVIVEKAKLEGKFFGIMNTLPDLSLIHI